MKKMIALVVALITVLTIPTVALAANQTVLTTTVPAATYTLNVPADQTVNFGATETKLTGLSITDLVGFAEGKNVAITVSYDAFTCEGINTTIPISLNVSYSLGYDGYYNEPWKSGESLLFIYNSTLKSLNLPSYKTDNYTAPFVHLLVTSNSTDWGKALAGEYTATITFTAEVVAE